MAKKTSVKSKGQRTPSKRRAGAGARAMAGGAGGRRRTAGAKTPQGKARRKSTKNPPRPGKAAKAPGGRTQTTRKGGAKTRSGGAKGTAAGRTAPRAKAKTARGGASRRTGGAAKTGSPRRSAGGAKAGGTGRERELAQTPEAGRTVRGRTNPMPTKRSTGTPSGAGSTRQAPALDRARRRLREIDETVEGPPSSLDMNRTSSAARSGRRHLQHALEEHTETGPAMTGGDVDADWQDAYAVGDEAPGGDNPTPDQDVVEEIGRAMGVEYQDNEELKGADKIAERDRHRWELDPASSDDYLDRE